MRSQARFRHTRGFTLIEVLVALMVLAIALAALVKSAGEAGLNAAYLRDKALAGIVAQNKIDELQIQRAWPSGNSNGTVEMAKRKWHWNLKVENTEDASIKRIVVSVAEDGEKERVLHSVTSFLGKP